MSSTKKRRLLFIGISAGALYLLLRLTPLPEMEALEKTRYSIPLFSAQNNLMAVLPLDNGLRREFLSIDSLDQRQIKTILQSEDSRFFFHWGVDPMALARAVWQYVQSGEIQSGGSTITMQLIGLLNPERRGIRGKIREVIDAVRLETRLGKKEILEHYINRLPFGSNIEGLKSASSYFLGKEPRELETEELLMLMMIPRRPGDYNPLKNPKANRNAVERTEKRISSPLSGEALDRLFLSLERREASWPSLYPHFTLMVQSRISEEQWSSGDPVYTSLDEDIQKGAQSYLLDILAKTEGNRISNGAVLAVDNETAEILAYVGSADFYDDQGSGQIDGIRILRQPGSTLKPFLYAKAIESGFGPSSPLPDIPMEFGSREIYIPENYNERFNGPVRLSVALGSSLNVPAVYLLERVGVKPFLEKLVGAGFRSLEKGDNLGVGLALGNGEVSLWELVQGYTLFSRGGDFIPLSFDRKAAPGDPRKIFRSEVAYMIRSILSDNRNRILGFGRSNPLEVPFDAAFKTGTSNQFNNIWALGSTEDMTVGVWMGNFSGETVIASPGSSYPARIVVSVLEDFRKEDRFSANPGFVTRSICSLSGKAAGPHCPYTVEQLFSEGEYPGNCDWHSGEGTFLPAEYGRWSDLYRQDYRIRRPDSQVEIAHPSEGSLFYLDPTLPEETQAIPVRILGRNDVTLYINDKAVYREKAPFTYYCKVERGSIKLRAESAGRSDSVVISVK